jgi:hypothetical protein
MDKTATLFTGDECWVRFTTGIAAETAKLQPNNKAGLKDGQKIGILFNGRIRIFKVEIGSYQSEVESERLAGARIVLLSNQVGNADFESVYWKGSGAKFFARRILGTSKAKWSLTTTTLTIIGACGAAVNSAQTATCSGLHCVTPLSRILLGVAALAAIVGWMKENLS